MTQIQMKTTSLSEDNHREFVATLEDLGYLMERDGPHLVLGLPPSDNRIWRAHSGLRKNAIAGIAAVIHSSSAHKYKEILSFVFTSNILSKEAREYVNETRSSLGCSTYRVDDKKRQGVHFRAPLEVRDNEDAFLVYRPYFKDRRRDAGNCKKILEDTLFDQDRYVHTWVLPARVDKEHPRVEMWLYRVPKT